MSYIIIRYFKMKIQSSSCKIKYIFIYHLYYVLCINILNIRLALVILGILNDYG
jgi:hypothetical protein